eukprot:SAG11_NODE_24106_length_378_cov_0.731183_1_plen_36_part_10
MSFRKAQQKLGGAGKGWRRLGAAVAECRLRNEALEQ